MSMSLVRKTAVHLTTRAKKLHTNHLLYQARYSSAKSTVKLSRSFSTSDAMASSQQQDLGNAFEDSEIQAYIDDIKTLIVKEALVKGSDRKTKVVDFKIPEELTKLLPLEIRKDGASHKELLEVCKTVIDYSVKTSNPRFFNQLYGGLNVYGMTGSWLSDALNTNIVLLLIYDNGHNKVKNFR